MSDLVKPLRMLVRSFWVAVLVTFVLAAATAFAWSQTPPAATPKSVIIQVTPASPVVPTDPPAVVPAAPEPTPPAPENPGLINEIGKLFNNPTSMWSAMPSLPSFKMPGDSLDVMPKMNTMVKGRMVCPVAANGAPDCKTASDRLCQSKGFKEGKSMDTDAAQSCSVKAMMPGRKPEEGDCKTENFVTRALCQ
ncbi:hypothetical protein [Tardiphaga sp.]|uniref:hypothetical protein n=1 Tax=Tardiphaga sp. TaxID=1926292 RepID=UPI0026343E7E|nr:hypothetical protein [Tardiphaga sp.]MDB5617238.1 hypothetical protein [Tardiphaga sp.]